METIKCQNYIITNGVLQNKKIIIYFQTALRVTLVSQSKQNLEIFLFKNCITSDFGLLVVYQIWAITSGSVSAKSVRIVCES